MTQEQLKLLGWRPSDPRLDPLRCYMVNDKGERMDVQPKGLSYKELEALELQELDLDD